MAAKTKVITEQTCGHRKEFIKMFEKTAYTGNKHQIWSDFVYLCASALSQPLDYRQEREDEYLRIINSYGKETQDTFLKMFGELILAFAEEGFADILGEIYGTLGLTNAKTGQFFTPYHICKLMAALNGDNGSLTAEIGRKGYISVNDRCCGTGAMLIAFADHCKQCGIDYEQSVLFVAQDIDPVVALTCYLQMTLFNMPGYVIIGNSLSNEKPDEKNFWFTNAYFCREFHLKTQNAIDDANEITETEPDFDVMLRESDTGQFVFDFAS